VVSEQGYDFALRRRSRRQGRQRGCTVDIPQVELAKAGYDPSEPPPFYRVWGAKRGRIVIQLYRSR
jgi:hypothetical protein